MVILLPKYYHDASIFTITNLNIKIYNNNKKKKPHKIIT